MQGQCSLYENTLKVHKVTTIWTSDVPDGSFKNLQKSAGLELVLYPARSARCVFVEMVSPEDKLVCLPRAGELSTRSLQTGGLVSLGRSPEEGDGCCGDSRFAAVASHVPRHGASRPSERVGRTNPPIAIVASVSDGCSPRHARGPEADLRTASSAPSGAILPVSGYCLSESRLFSVGNCSTDRAYALSFRVRISDRLVFLRKPRVSVSGDSARGRGSARPPTDH
jgi:hypothetical protein